MKKHLITDWDGVLGATADMNYEITTELHPDTSRDDFVNHHLGNVYEHPVIPFTEESSTRYFELYNQRLSTEHIRLSLPATIDLGNRYRLHVVTSNCEHAVRNVLREAGVEHIFGQILGREAHASKMEKFNRLFLEEDFCAADSLYITDTVGDLKEATKVGLRTIAVTFGYHPSNLLAKQNPTKIANSWEEVIRHADTLMR